MSSIIMPPTGAMKVHIHHRFVPSQREKDMNIKSLEFLATLVCFLHKKTHLITSYFLPYNEIGIFTTSILIHVLRINIFILH
jgi:hypothetical protein